MNLSAKWMNLQEKRSRKYYSKENLIDRLNNQVNLKN
jgi:hypothetical protein